MKRKNRKMTKLGSFNLSQLLEGSDQILSSENDKKIFIESLMNPQRPNKNLRKAFKLHQDFMKNIL
jgi:uncharacterized protein (DUF1778 family)